MPAKCRNMINEWSKAPKSFIWISGAFFIPLLFSFVS